jgi:serine phosphatase RsbU (regulator of sigma subunit)
MFSDGYADQFGGPNGKKFKYKSLKELLVKITNQPMAEQGRILNQTIEEWRGLGPQLDDIIISGIHFGKITMSL